MLHKYTPLFTLLLLLLSASLAKAATVTQLGSFVSESVAATTYYGLAIETGDINGDGYEDVAVSSANENSNTGKLYVYFGGASFDSTADIEITNSTGQINGFPVGFDWGTFAFDDLDGDGFDDIVIGNRTVDEGGNTNNGAVYIFYGAASLSGELDDTDADQTIYGTIDNAKFGAHAWIDDMNGDGKNDLLVNNTVSATTGHVFVFYGNGTQSLDTTVDETYDTNDEAASTYARYTLLTGDVNGDGVPDIIGDQSGDNVYIMYGTGSGATGIDVTIDADSGALAPYGAVDVGDVNGDGTDDVCFGQFIYDNVDTDDGTVYCIYGSNSLTSSITASSTNDLQLFGQGNAGDNFGRHLHIQDVNNDGNLDIIVGAYESSGDADGYVQVFFGNGTDSFDTTADITITKSAGDRYGHWVEASDMDNDGYIEIIGTEGDGTASSNGVVYVHEVDHGTASAGTPGVSGTTVAGTATETVNLAGVQWSTSSTSTGTWTECTGTFGSTSAAYSCDVSGVSSDGTIYIRTYDENDIYLPAASYGSVQYIVASSVLSETSTPPVVNLPTAKARINKTSKVITLGENTVTTSNDVRMQWEKPSDSSNISQYYVFYKEKGASSWESKKISSKGDSIDLNLDDGNYVWFLRTDYSDGSTNESATYEVTIEAEEGDVEIEEITGDESVAGILSDLEEESIIGTLGETISLTFDTDDGIEIIVEIWDSAQTVKYDAMVCGDGKCDHGHILDGPYTLVIYTRNSDGEEGERKVVKISPYGTQATTNIAVQSGATQGVQTQVGKATPEVVKKAAPPAPVTKEAKAPQSQQESGFETVPQESQAKESLWQKIKSWF